MLKIKTVTITALVGITFNIALRRESRLESSPLTILFYAKVTSVSFTVEGGGVLIGIRTLVKMGVLSGRVGGSVASWLVQSSLDQVLLFQALAGNVMFLGKTLFSELPLPLPSGVCMGYWST